MLLNNKLPNREANGLYMYLRTISPLLKFYLKHLARHHFLWAQYILSICV